MRHHPLRGFPEDVNLKKKKKSQSFSKNPGGNVKSMQPFWKATGLYISKFFTNASHFVQ
jgi:hypothetical protein